MLRSHTCGELNEKEIGKKVELAGWVHSRRDHGGIIFVDLRDRYGLTQVKFIPENEKVFEVADELRNEWVIQVKGEILKRPADMINEKLKTGEIEVLVNELNILNKSKTLPFVLDEEKGEEANENIRLKYRFIDLRRPKLQEMLKVRDEMIRDMRSYFYRNDFREIQTPILTSSSPEGARDFIVPSRIYPGKFYALPQAPQQFKQLLMVGGLTDIFKLHHVFEMKILGWIDIMESSISWIWK